ncbi:MAG TPA: hypothetical protein VF773_11230 [Verrucomicrobiae bacterium]
MAALLLSVLPLIAEVTNVPVEPPTDVDDFDPGLLLFVVVMLAACAFLVGAGLLAGIVAFALTGALTAFGIMSSSVVIGFIRRSPASGFRALVIQLGAVAGIPCGIGAMWLVSWLADSQSSTAFRLLVGGVCGLSSGVAVALLFNFAWGRTSGWFLNRIESRKSKVDVVNA